MTRSANARRHPRIWTVGIALVVVAVLAAGGGTAAKVRSDRPSNRHALSRQPIAPTTTSAAVLAAASATGRNRKPRRITTTSPSTTSPSTTTTAPGDAGDRREDPAAGVR